MKKNNFLLIGLFICTACAVLADETRKNINAGTMQTLLSAPLVFEQNIGQVDKEVKFLSRTASGTQYFFTEKGVTILLTRKEKEHSLLQGEETLTQERATLLSHSLKISFVGSNIHPKITAEEQAETKVNYFIGNDPAKWKTGVSNFHRIRYHNIYDGIDLVYYGNGKQLEYDFVVHPGADPNIIRLHYEGSEEALALLENGSVAIRTSVGLLHEKKPFAYQMESKTEIVSSWKTMNSTDLEFSIGEYDHSKELYIDPLIFSTYLGGSGAEEPMEIKFDSEYNIVVRGSTTSTDFPIYGGVIDSSVSGRDEFVTKMTPDGKHLIWSTVFGGSGDDGGGGMEIDKQGNIYVNGTTTSTDFPVTPSAFDTSYNGGGDAFVTKLNSTGSSIIFSTYLGGNSSESRIQNIADDNTGNSYITGYTSSTSGFPVTPDAFDTVRTPGQAYQSFIAKLDSIGNSLIYCTYLGQGRGYGLDISVDDAGRCYICGWTVSTLPTTPNAIFPTYRGGEDSYFAVMSPEGDSVVYCTYLGGSGNDYAYGLRRNPRGEIFMCGWTNSPNFPVTTNAYDTTFTNDGQYDSFVMKIDSSLTTILWSTFIGDSGWQDAYTMDIDKDDNVYVGGRTTAGVIPTTRDAFSSSYNGGDDGDAFFVKYNATGFVLMYGTYLGGSGNDYLRTLAVDSAGDVYLVTRTHSGDFPTTPGVYDSTLDGDRDVAITKFSLPYEASSIKGSVFSDANGNGVQDSAEIMLSKRYVQLDSNKGYVLTDANGEYSFHSLPADSYTVRLAPRKKWGASYPPEGLYNVQLDSGQSLPEINFGAQPLSLGYDLAITSIIFSHFPDKKISPCCGSAFYVNINYANNGATTEGSKIEIILTGELQYAATIYYDNEQLSAPLINPSNKQIEFGIISGHLKSGESGTIVLNVMPTCKDSIELKVKANIEPHEQDDDKENNKLTKSIETNCVSGDPNDIHVTPKGCGPLGFITNLDSLIYVIRFQNTGNGPAYNVIIRDTLDDDLDISTVQTIETSHPYIFTENGRELVWSFYAISLPDSGSDEPGSHGFVKFTAKQLPSLPVATEFSSRAGIYFDFNDVVLTNSVLNTITNAPLPQANFTMTKDTVKTFESIDFVYTGDTTNTTYSWNFGEDAYPEISTEKNPTGILYTTSGEKIILLRTGLGECSSEPFTTILNVLEVAQIDVNVLPRWNIVSIPLRTVTNAVDSLLKERSSSVYSFSEIGTYSEQETLRNGYGYWVKFPSSTTLSMIGNPIYQDSINVVAGWNLIGSISVSIADSQIASVPPGLVTSQFFTYDGKYAQTNIIQPGKGYWVKVSNTGKLIFSQATQTNVERIKIVPTKELPPSSPDGQISEVEKLPDEYSLWQAYPNPFNPRTMIKFTLPNQANVTLKIYNTLGQEVAVLFNQKLLSEGLQEAEFDASGLSSGLYFYRITAQGIDGISFTDVKKMLLMK